MSDGYPIDYFRCFDCAKKIVTDETAIDARDQLNQLKDEVRNLKHELHELRKKVEYRQVLDSQLLYGSPVSVSTNWHMDGRQHFQALTGMPYMQAGEEGRGGS